MPRTVTIAIPKIAEIRKAIAAGVAADVPLLISDFTGNHWAQADILGLVAASVGAGLVVFGVKNKKDAETIAAIVDAVVPAAAPVVAEVLQAVDPVPPATA